MRSAAHCQSAASFGDTCQLASVLRRHCDMRAIILSNLLVSTLLAFELDPNCNLRGQAILRVSANSTKQVDYVINDKKLHAMGFSERYVEFLHPFFEDLAPGLPLLVLGTRDLLRSIAHLMKTNGVHAELIGPIENENYLRSYQRAPIKFTSLQEFNSQEYYTLEELNVFARLLQHQLSAHVRVETIGESYLRKPIYVTTITSGPKTAQRNTIFLECGIHAREWISPAVCVRMAHNLALHLLNATPKGPLEIEVDQLAQLLEKHDFSFVFLINPDGYEHSWTHDRFWRKSRSLPAGCSSRCRLGDIEAERNDECERRACCRGVDLNRNWDAMWSDRQNCTCCADYAGSSAFSEPETRSLSDYVLREQEKIMIYISMHCYTQLIAYPYAWGDNNKMHLEERQWNYVTLSHVSKAIKEVDGKKYMFGAASQSVYTANGTSVDWIHNSTSVPLAYTIELRPTVANTGDPRRDRFSLPRFCLPKEQIGVTTREFIAGLQVLSEQALKVRNYDFDFVSYVRDHDEIAQEYELDHKFREKMLRTTKDGTSEQSEKLNMIERTMKKILIWTLCLSTAIIVLILLALGFVTILYLSQRRRRSNSFENVAQTDAHTVL